MGKYRKRPIEVEAVRWTGENIDAVLALADGSADPPPVVIKGAHVLVQTLEGTMVGRPGDWIICGVEGEIYPCKDSVFRTTYEQVPAPQPVVDQEEKA